jgi:hypothetical protein
MHPMAELKTRQNDQDVHEFLEGVSNETRKKDCYEVLELMRAATGVEAKMWGDSIIGFGSYHYKYASGREGDWFLTGFSPRKQNLNLYIMPGFDEYEGLMKKLGKYKTGKSCLYLNKLEDVDLAVLKTLIEKSVKKMQEV